MRKREREKEREREREKERERKLEVGSRAKNLISADSLEIDERQSCGSF